MPLILALIAAACVATPQPRGESARLAATIVAVEEARLAAFRADDKPAFARLVADDLLMVHSNGEISGKADEMAAMRPATAESPLPTLHLENTAVRGVGTGAVLTGSLVERSNGRVALRLRFTNVYARRRGHWQLVVGQLTRADSE